MDVLLWRHAEAEEGPDDFARPLTERGKKQAASVAAWLSAASAAPAARHRQSDGTHLPDGRSAWPAVSGHGKHRPGKRHTGPARRHRLVPARGSVLLVGHQPGLGHLASLLLAGQESDWSIKKGSLWWLARRVREGEPQTVLRTVISPDFLRGK